MSQYFQNLRIGTRLALSFGVIICLIAAMFACFLAGLALIVLARTL